MATGGGGTTRLKESLPPGRVGQRAAIGMATEPVEPHGPRTTREEGGCRHGSTKEMACQVDQTGLLHLFSAWVFKFRHMAAPKRWHARWIRQGCVISLVPGSLSSDKWRHQRDGMQVNQTGLGHLFSAVPPGPRTRTGRGTRKTIRLLNSGTYVCATKEMRTQVD